MYIYIHFEVRKSVHRGLTNFNQNNIELPYIELYKK